jgi:hypothetical protein
MAGRSPLDMMQSDSRAPRRRSAARAPRGWFGRIFVTLAIIVALGVGWCWLWYYAAAIANRALTGWVEREAASGRIYSCGAQSTGGFPFSIKTRCIQAAATINSYQPPFDVTATDITFTAHVYRPNLLIGDITGPVTLTEPGREASFVAKWSNARISLLGLPPDPERVTIDFGKPRFDRFAGASPEKLFDAESAELDGRIIQGSARNNPVIELVFRFAAATAPTLHPLFADPVKGDIDVVLRGLKDFGPKLWPDRFREIQAAGGGVEIKAFRLERADAIVVGTGTLTVNARGTLDGTIRVAVAGVENIVPLMGVDQVIGQSIGKLTGSSNQPASGLDALDRLLPGLSGVVRESANASLIESIKKMGEPTEIDKKPAVVLPLLVNDGVISVGPIPVAQLPPLF